MAVGAAQGEVVVRIGPPPPPRVVIPVSPGRAMFGWTAITAMTVEAMSGFRDDM